MSHPAHLRAAGWSATAHLLFDYRDDPNYKFSGLRANPGQWVIGAVQDGSETLPSTALRVGLAVATASPPAANTWYQLDAVVARVGGQDRVTLYANDVERGLDPQRRSPPHRRPGGR